MTAEPTIDYEALAQEAMRGVVRTVLVRTAKSGFPGDHHFYISFDTEALGRHALEAAARRSIRAR